MGFTPESLQFVAAKVFGRERVVSVLCNSPSCDEKVAIVELFTALPTDQGAIRLSDLVHFAGIIDVKPMNVWVREQSSNALELWLVQQKQVDSVQPT